MTTATTTIESIENLIEQLGLDDPDVHGELTCHVECAEDYPFAYEEEEDQLREIESDNESWGSCFLDYSWSHPNPSGRKEFRIWASESSVWVDTLAEARSALEAHKSWLDEADANEAKYARLDFRKNCERPIQVEINRDYPDASDTIRFAPARLVDLGWWKEFVGELPSTKPTKLIEHSATEIVYQTEKSVTITERSASFPEDRWGRPYEPWNPEEADHILWYSDHDASSFGRFGGLTDDQFDSIVAKYPDRVELINIDRAEWFGTGHCGTLQGAQQEASEWSGTSVEMLVGAPDLTEEEIQGWIRVFELEESGFDD